MPAEQFWQTLGLVAATAVLNLPAAQLSHTASAWALKVPAGHPSQWVAPTATAVDSTLPLHQHNRRHPEPAEALHDTLPPLEERW